LLELFDKAGWNFGVEVVVVKEEELEVG